ncbi:MAG: PEGA domain-containing protein [Methanoregulaceae archaeon]|jgi:hypothetical protein|nr:PEGA domain-containing protein [Methanoregulaceae archaeon]
MFGTFILTIMENIGKIVSIILIIAVAMIGAVTAADTPSVSQPIGGDTGYYYISSNPSGASASVDGTSVGLTPTTATLYVTGPPGHTVTVSKQGYQTWNQYFSGNPAAGQTINVYASLVPNVQTGTIYVSSSPSGASAVLDNGYDQIITPGSFYSVSTGYHTVQVSMAGYQPYSTNIPVSATATSNVYATLTPNQQVGSISVSSIPKSASVYIDNIFQGMTNVVVGNLYAGPHTVTLKLAGYQTWTNTVAVNSQQTTYISATLTPVSSPQTGDLQVSSSPSGAAIYLNDDYKGTTMSTGPFSITGLNPGTYSVVLKKTGYQDYTTSTTILAGSTAQVSAVLQPAGTPSSTASAEITSDPSGADVYINNAYKGITPLNFQNVPIDTTQAYTVTIKMTGYEPYTTSGKISPGQYIQIDAALTPSSQPAPAENSRTIWYVIGGIGIIAVIILIAYVVMQRKKAD